MGKMMGLKRGLALVLSLMLSCSQTGLTTLLATDGGMIQTAESQCTHHEEHTLDCGYEEGTVCAHEHGEECYATNVVCTFVETDEGEVLANAEATETEPIADKPAHECTEETGCVTKGLDCTHEHDEVCGFGEGTACTFVCGACAPADSGNQGTPQEPQPPQTPPEKQDCSCETLCTESVNNADCLACAEDYSLCTVEQVAPDAEVSETIITAFDPLDEAVEQQNLAVGTELSQVNLPDRLTVQGVTIGMPAEPTEPAEPATEPVAEPMTIEGVTWEVDPTHEENNGNDQYRPEKGNYIFTPILPEGFGVVEGVSLPAIHVTVGDATLFATQPEGPTFNLQWSTITIEEGTQAGTFQVRDKLGDILADNIPPSTPITVTGKTNDYSIKIDTGTVEAPVQLIFDNLILDQTGWGDTLVVNGHAKIILVAGTNNMLNMKVATGTGTGIALSDHSSVTIGGEGKLTIDGINGATNNATGSSVTITGGIITSGVIKSPSITITGGTITSGAIESTSTTITGNPFIMAASIKDRTNVGEWSGVVFEGNGGKIYGNTTLTTDVEIPSGKDLTIDAGTTLGIGANTSLTTRSRITTKGTLDIHDSGSVINEGTIEIFGQVTGTGTIYNNNLFRTQENLSFGGKLVNNEKVEIGHTKTLTITENGTVENNGRISLNSENTLISNGTLILNARSTLSSSGTVEINGAMGGTGTLTNLGILRIGGTTSFAGKLINDAQANITGDFTIANGGILENNGMVIVEDNASLTKADNGQYLGAGGLNKQGTGAITGMDTVPLVEGAVVGDFIINGDAGNYTYDSSKNTLTISGGDLTINGLHSTVKTSIILSNSANLTLNHLNIQSGELERNDRIPFTVSAGAYQVTLTLQGDNILRGGSAEANSNPAMKIGSGAVVTIQGDGRLEAIGSPHLAPVYYQNGSQGGAGISGDVIIESGTVKAFGGRGGSANSANNAAGSGGDGIKGTVTIKGGTVIAIPGDKGAQGKIGVRGKSIVGTTTISGGMVTAVDGITGDFSTGTKGKAVIVTEDTLDTTNQGSWSGVIFKGTEGKIYGSSPFTLATDAETIAGRTLTIASGETLVIPDGRTFTNNGTIAIASGGAVTIDSGGRLINNGTITNEGTFTNDGRLENNTTIEGTGTADGTGSAANPSQVVVSFTKDNVVVTEAGYGDTIQVVATISQKTRSAAPNTVNFYIGEPNVSNLLGTAKVENGSAKLEVELTGEHWAPDSDRYTFYADFGGADGLLESSANSSLKVDKGDQPTTGVSVRNTVSGPDVTTVTYGDTPTIIPLSLSVGADGMVPTVTYSAVDRNTEQNQNLSDVATASGINITLNKTGKFYVKVVIGETAYYNSKTIYSSQITVDSAESSFTVKMKNGDTVTNNFTYGDTITVEITDIDIKSSTSRAVSKNMVYLFATDPGTAPNQSQAIASANVSGNGATLTYPTTNKRFAPEDSKTLYVLYGGSDSLKSTTQKITVNLAPQKLTATIDTTKPNASKVYDGATAFSAVPLTLTGLVNNDSTTATASGASADSAVGTHSFTPTAVTLAGDGSDCYTLATTDVTGSVKIEQKELQPSISGTTTKVYDGNLSCDGSGLSIALAGVVSGDDVTATATYGYNDINVGSSKTINASGITLTGSKAGNYKLSTTTVLQSAGAITKFTPKVTSWPTYTLTYGQTLADATGIGGTATGVNGDDRAGNFVWINDQGYYDTDTVPSVSDSGTTSYILVFISSGLSANNYEDVINDSMTVTVNPRELTPSISGTTTKVYDGTTGYGGSGLSIALAGVVSGDDVTATATYTYNDGDVGAGKFITASGITLSEAKAGNYKLSDTLTTLTANVGTITQAPLTITANPHSITYGEAPANDGVGYSGFVNSEDEKDLSGSLSYEYSYSQYDNVGDYTITPRGYTSTNYAITFETGKLTVLQKEVGLNWNNITNRKYNDGKVVTATATGLVNDDVIDVTVDNGESTAVGTHTATAQIRDNTGNYKLPTALTQEYTIEQAQQQELLITDLPEQIYRGTTFVLTTSGGSGEGATSWAVLEGNATIDETGTVVVTGTGAITIAVTKAGDSNYLSATTTIQFTVKTKSSGGGGGGGGSYTPEPSDQTNLPTSNEVTLGGQQTSGGNAQILLSDQQISQAIATAKQQGNPNGISIGFQLEQPQNANSLAITLSKTALNELIANQVQEFKIQSNFIGYGLNLEALKAVSSSATGSLTITAKIANRNSLSISAQTAIGNRPVFDLSITSGNKTITSFGKGSTTVWMPYTPAVGEKTGALQAVYLPANGMVTPIMSSSYDKNSQSMIFSTNHFSAFGMMVQPAPIFTDTLNHWAEEEITFVTSRGLIAGINGTIFSPNTAMSRGDLAVALGKLVGINPKDYQTQRFTDVKPELAPYVNWAVSKGILQGKTSSTFSPNQGMSRQEMAVLMEKYVKIMGYNLPKTRTAVAYIDSSSIAENAKESVKQMQMVGIMMGKDHNRFNPSALSTRAEVSAMLHRLVKLTISSDTAEGWTVNDSGQRIYIQNGWATIGTRTIAGVVYTFDHYGALEDQPNNLKGAFHTVRPGDSFWLIAKQYNCTMELLERLNGQSRYSLIFPGQVLKLPTR